MSLTCCDIVAGLGGIEIAHLWRGKRRHPFEDNSDVMLLIVAYQPVKSVSSIVCAVRGL